MRSAIRTSTSSRCSSATAADTARVLNSLLAQSGEAGGTVKIVADDRSNSILVSGDPTARLRVKALVAHLDTPGRHRHRDPGALPALLRREDLATRLKEQMGARSTTGTNGQQQRQSERSRSRMPGQHRARGRDADLDDGAGPATISLAGGKATIWADKDTNALVITADPRSMRALNAVIDKLDIRRPQVLVRGDHRRGGGRQDARIWASTGRSMAPTTTLGVGGFISPVAAPRSSICTTTSRAAARARPPASAPTGATIGIGRLKASGVNFAAMLRALQGDARTNIIATPSVVTRDNQEAKMEVAQEVPFLTGQYTHHQRHRQAFQTIQREDVGTHPDRHAAPSAKAMWCC